MGSFEQEQISTAIPGGEEYVLEKRIKELEEILSKERAEHKEQVKYLEEQAGIDYLTGASNRRTFERELEQSLKMIRGEEKEEREGVEQPKNIALISLDLNDFKKINDLHGHLAGDEVLKKVVMLLVSLVRDTDIVARMGGDEFMILLRGADKQFAAQKVEELRTEMGKITFDFSTEIRVTASIGVVSSEDSTDIKDLYARVDENMYAEKRLNQV